jgi:hypothetical protein
LKLIQTEAPKPRGLSFSFCSKLAPNIEIQMTLALVSTIIRNTDPSASSGHIYVVDVEKQNVLQRSTIIEPPYKTLDPNPRGGTRGGRGIALGEDQIAIANYSMIFRYSPKWEFLGLISNPLTASIHDTVFQDGTLWVTSAANDLTLQMDMEGNILQCLQLRENLSIYGKVGWHGPVLYSNGLLNHQKIDFRNPMLWDNTVFDNAHVNSISTLSNGDFLISLGLMINPESAALTRLKSRLMRLRLATFIKANDKEFGRLMGEKINTSRSAPSGKQVKGKSAVLRVTPSGERSLVLVFDSVSTPSHSLLTLNDETAIYLHTSEGTVVRFEPESGKIISQAKVTNGFLRGAVQLSEQMIILGSSSELILFDYGEQTVHSRFKISRQAGEAIYDIKILPPYFSLPPESFEDHLLRTTDLKNAAIASRNNGFQDGQINPCA